jgi:hypothetical protein
VYFLKEEQILELLALRLCLVLGLAELMSREQFHLFQLAVHHHNHKWLITLAVVGWIIDPYLQTHMNLTNTILHNSNGETPRMVSLPVQGDAHQSNTTGNLLPMGQ